MRVSLPSCAQPGSRLVSAVPRVLSACPTDRGHAGTSPRFRCGTAVHRCGTAVHDALDLRDASAMLHTVHLVHQGAQHYCADTAARDDPCRRKGVECQSLRRRLCGVPCRLSRRRRDAWHGRERRRCRGGQQCVAPQGGRCRLGRQRRLARCDWCDGRFCTAARVANGTRTVLSQPHTGRQCTAGRPYSARDVDEDRRALDRQG